jgi:hypothetical protein
MKAIGETSVVLWETLSVQLSNEIVIQKLHEQLAKDFDRIGKPFTAIDKEAPNDWIVLLAKVLSKLTTEELDQLLYVIDLPENWSRQLTADSTNFLDMAEAILYRELTKIYFKIQYSSH